MLVCALLLPAQFIEDKEAFIAVVLILVGVPSGVEVMLALGSYSKSLHVDRRLRSNSSLGSFTMSTFTTPTSSPAASSGDSTPNPFHHESICL